MAEVRKYFENPNVVQNATPLPPRRNLLKFWAKTPTPAPKELPKPKDVEFKKNEFTLETGTKNAEKVKFDDVMQADFQMQLENSLTTLINIYNDDPASEIFSSDRLSFLPKMMEDLCEKDTLGYKLNPDIIKNRLQKDPRVWKEAMQLIEYDLSLTEMALAVEAQVHPNELNMFLFPKGVDTKSSQFAKTGRIHLGINRGKLNQFLVGKSLGVGLGITSGAAGSLAGAVVGGPIIGSPAVQAGISSWTNTLTAGRVAIGSAVNALGPQGLGALAGIVPGIATGAVTGLAAKGIYDGARSALSNGITLDIEQNTKLLDILKNDPQNRFGAEKAYLKKVLHIDVDDYEVSGDKIKTRPQFQRSADIGRIENQFVDKIASRFNFLTKGLGIPADKVRAVPDNMAFSYVRTGIIPGTPRVDKANFEPITTTWKKEEMNRYAELEKAKLATGASVLTTADRLDLVYQARCDVMNKNLNRRLLEARLKKGADSSTIQILDNKVNARTQDNGEIVKEKTNELTEIKKTLQEIKPILAAEQPSFSNYSEARRNLDRVRTEIQRKLGVSTIEEIDKELRSREDLPTQDIDQLIQDLRSAETAVENTRTAVENLDRQFDSIHTTLDALTDPTSGIDAQLASHGLTTAGLSKADFQTTPISELLRRINRAAEAGVSITGAWDSGANDSAKRVQLLQMVAEANAETHTAISSPHADLTTWKSAGISENFMRNATTQTLHQELIARGVPGATGLSLSNPADVARLQRTIEQARERFDLRSHHFMKALQEEPSEMAQFNNAMDADKTRFQQDADFFQAEAAELAREENAIRVLRKNPETAENFIIDHTQDHLNYYSKFASWDATLASTLGTAYGGELNPSALVGLSTDQILSRINAANMLHARAIGMPSSIGWNASDNRLDTNIRTLLSVHSEIQVLQSLPEIPGSSYEEFHTTHGVTERDFLTKTSSQIIEDLRNRGVVITNDKATRRKVEEAISFEKSRMSGRVNQLSKSITEYQRSSNPNADIAFLNLRTDYVDAVTAHSAHISRLATDPTVRRSGLTLINSAQFNTRAGVLQNAVNTLNTRRLTDISAIRNEFVNTIDTYTNAQTTLTTVRENIGTRANGVQSITELQAIKAGRSATSDDELNNMRTQLQTELDKCDPSAELVTKAQEKVENMKSAAETIQDMYFTFGILDEAALRTMPYEEIMKTINDFYNRSVSFGLAIPCGWPADENVRADRRMLVANAIAEAKADVSAGIPLTASIYLPDLRREYSDYQMMTRTPAELVSDAAALRPPRTITEAYAEEIIDALRTMHDKRQKAHQSMIDEMDSRDRELDRRIANAKDEVKKDATLIQETRAMLKGQGAVFTRSRIFLEDVSRGKTLVDVIGPHNEDRFTAAEQSLSGIPTGYFEFMNVLTGYKESNTEGDRDGRFSNMLDIAQFKPEAIAQRANDLANLGFAPPLSSDPMRVFGELQRRIQRGQIKADTMYDVIKGFTDDFKEISLAK